MVSKGPLPKTEDGNIYVLGLCDCFSKWTEAYAIPSQDFFAIKRDCICRLVIPLRINIFEAIVFYDILLRQLSKILIIVFLILIIIFIPKVN